MFFATRCVVFFSLLVSFCSSLTADINTVKHYGAHPSQYDHTKGGGGVNDAGRTVVGSLNGGDFRCNDLVSFFVVVEVKTNPVNTSTQCFRFNNTYTSDSTGQSGVAFYDVRNVTISGLSADFSRRAKSVGGANPNCTGCVQCQLNNGIQEGWDCAYKGNGNEYTKFIYEFFSHPPFTGNNADLYVIFDVCGLDPGEVIPVRIDIRIACYPFPKKPTGTLQGAIKKYCAHDQITNCDTPRQSVPLQNPGAILGFDGNCTANDSLPITGPDFYARVRVQEASNTGGGVVYYDMNYSWAEGAYKLTQVNPASVANGTQNVTLSIIQTFDTECSFLHNGQTQQFMGGCGCTLLDVPNSQPQLFLSVNSSYYNLTNPRTATIGGVNVLIYEATSQENVVRYLYVRADNTSYIVQADFWNGDVWYFTDVVLRPQPASLFVYQNTTVSFCKCYRYLNMEFVIQRDKFLFVDDKIDVVLFLTNLIQYFEISPQNTQIGALWYDKYASTPPTDALAVNSGTNWQTVQNYLSSIKCNYTAAQGQQLSDPCGEATGSLAAGVSQAIADLQTVTRTASKNVIVMVVKDINYEADAVAIKAQTDRALALGYELFLVVYESNDANYFLNDFVGGESKQDTNLFRDLIRTADDLTGAIIEKLAGSLCVTAPSGCVGCCANCDETCSGGACRPVDECLQDTSFNCSSKNVFTGTCCVLVTGQDFCPQDNPCFTYSCNPTTGQCSNTSICGVGAPDTACYDYFCTGGNTCSRSFKGKNYSCQYEECSNNVLINVSITCNANTSCFGYYCDPTRGQYGECVGEQLDAPDSDPCKIWTCANGWTYENKSCPSDACNPGVCVAGECVFSPKICILDANNKCDQSYCNPATGNCVFANKTCADPAACQTSNYPGNCNPTTGNCSYVDVVCPANSSCPGFQTRCVNDVCECTFTFAPTRSPSIGPTRAPSNAPTTRSPTNAPTEQPTNAPTVAPSDPPTDAPSNAPTQAPSDAPTRQPTDAPTETPTDAPTVAPTRQPTNAPTETPTDAPTTEPTNPPIAPGETYAPTNPTDAPSTSPTRNPTDAPTEAPTAIPTENPTRSPTSAPTEAPTTEAPTDAPTAAPSNAPTQAPTNAPTRNPTNAPTEAPTELVPTDPPTFVPCQCTNDACNSQLCLEDGTCDVLVPINCTQFLRDTCQQVTGCDISTGCQFAEITCPTASSLCHIVPRDETVAGCCLPEIPKVCTPATSPCFESRCNASDGSCYLAYLCDSNDPCQVSYCNDTTGCTTRPVTCDNPSPNCFTAACVNGECELSAVDCDDNNPCTIDTCETGGCVNTNRSCPSTTCSLGQCDPVSGNCVSTAVICDDGIDCTVDTCDDLVPGGCVHTPYDILCDQANDECYNITCSATLGCLFEPKICPNASKYFCKNDTCRDFVGCETFVRDCANNISTNESCSYYQCKENTNKPGNGTCELIGLTCSYFGAIIGAIAGGIIAGAVIAAAAIILLGAMLSGGAYAVSRNVLVTPDGSVNNNILYQPKGKGADVAL